MAQVSLVLVGAVLVTIGTLVSQVVWLAVAATLVVAFAVLFAGVVSSVLASATTALLISFILPVSLPGPVGSIPRPAVRLAVRRRGVAGRDRHHVAGSHARPAAPVDRRACALLARRLAAEVDCVRDDFGPERTAALRRLSDQATSAVGALSRSFYGAPYRPTGLTIATRTLVRLTDQVVWLDALLRRAPVDRRPGPNDQVVCDIELAAAALLERGAALLDSEDGDPHELDPALERLQAAREAMEGKVTAALPVHRVPAGAGDGPGGRTPTEFVSALEPSFRAEELSFATSAIAANIALTVAARRRSWWQRMLGRRPEGVASPLASAQERAGAHVERHSVWLRNSVRGAIALSLAVLVAKLTGAAAAARRLDDAFREFLAERGTKHIAMADVTTLLTAVAVLRLTADAILDLWSGADHARSGDRTAARWSSGTSRRHGRWAAREVAAVQRTPRSWLTGRRPVAAWRLVPIRAWLATRPGVHAGRRAADSRSPSAGRHWV